MASDDPAPEIEPLDHLVELAVYGAPCLVCDPADVILSRYDARVERALDCSRHIAVHGLHSVDRAVEIADDVDRALRIENTVVLLAADRHYEYKIRLASAVLFHDRVSDLIQPIFEVLRFVSVNDRLSRAVLRYDVGGIASVDRKKREIHLPAQGIEYAAHVLVCIASLTLDVIAGMASDISPGGHAHFDAFDRPAGYRYDHVKYDTSCASDSEYSVFLAVYVEELPAVQQRSVKGVSSAHAYLLVDREQSLDRRMRDVIACEHRHGICESYAVVSSESSVFGAYIAAFDDYVDRLAVEVMVGIESPARYHVHVALQYHWLSVLVAFRAALVDDYVADLILYVLEPVLLCESYAVVAYLFISVCPPRDHRESFELLKYLFRFNIA